MDECFIIMPITTPPGSLEVYNKDEQHFQHVLDTIFIPAIKRVGYEPIPPKSGGSNVIHADIVQGLSSAKLVLCDMSALNPNVFFEFGIRTALNKPVALVVDDKSDGLPFDTGIINYHKYDSSLNGWMIEREVNSLAEHLKETLKKGGDFNALWKYFGVSQVGKLRTTEPTTEDKTDLLLSLVQSIIKRMDDTETMKPQVETLRNLLSHDLAFENMRRHPDDLQYLLMGYEERKQLLKQRYQDERDKNIEKP